LRATGEYIDEEKDKSCETSDSGRVVVDASPLPSAIYLHLKIPFFGRVPKYQPRDHRSRNLIRWMIESHILHTENKKDDFMDTACLNKKAVIK